jgi:hypothetical protein
MLPISDATKFPTMCCVCGKSTTNRVKVARSGKIAGATARSGMHPDYSWFIVVPYVSLVGLIMRLIAVARSQGPSDRGSLKAFVPHCKECSAVRPIEVSMVDLEHNRLGIIVSRQFASAVEEMNRR